jgi:hypothetical protein
MSVIASASTTATRVAVCGDQIIRYSRFLMEFILGLAAMIVVGIIGFIVSVCEILFGKKKRH